MAKKENVMIMLGDLSTVCVCGKGRKLAGQKACGSEINSLDSRTGALMTSRPCWLAVYVNDGCLCIKHKVDLSIAGLDF